MTKDELGDEISRGDDLWEIAKARGERIAELEAELAKLTGLVENHWQQVGSGTLVLSAQSGQPGELALAMHFGRELAEQWVPVKAAPTIPEGHRCTEWHRLPCGGSTCFVCGCYRFAP